MPLVCQIKRRESGHSSPGKALGFPGLNLMIRIGHLRWFIRIIKSRIHGGYVSYYFELVPQAHNITILVEDEEGMRDQTLLSPKICCERIEDAYDMSFPKNEMLVVSRLAEHLSVEAIRECMETRIINPKGYDAKVGMYIVKQALIRASQEGGDNDFQIEDLIDLSGDMRVAIEERERQRLALMTENEKESRLNFEKRKKAYAVSMDFLDQYLSQSEREEVKASGTVTIGTEKGDFVVPVMRHGFVERYVKGKLKTNHCIVFQDGSIPLGDEVLMKIILIKTDLEGFLQKSNMFF